jgi:hypothetical protein
MDKTDIDVVAAAKLNLELMLQENQQLKSKFSAVLEKLAQMETLDPKERRSKFRELEEKGELKFHGVDIRLFAHNSAPSKPLPAAEFLQRTRRRLRNTNTLLEEFIKRDVVKNGADLKDEIDALTYNIVNANNPPEVVEFKQKVEALRESATFTHYQSVKREFIKKDPDLKTDVDFVTAKETVEEGVENLQRREEDLKTLSQKMETGSISVNEAQMQLEELAMGTPN